MSNPLKPTKPLLQAVQNTLISSLYIPLSLLELLELSFELKFVTAILQFKGKFFSKEKGTFLGSKHSKEFPKF